jgi:putative nucleotidyltransferase with HDIG domain
VPLDRLKEGTLRLAGGDFRNQVKIKSNDEFEELADFFNRMSTRLGKQFDALHAIEEIGRAVLSELDTEKIVGTTLSRMQSNYQCSISAIYLIESNGVFHVQYFTDAKPGIMEEAIAVELNPDDFQAFYRASEKLSFTGDDARPRYLKPLEYPGIAVFYIFPLFLKEDLAGLIVKGYRESLRPTEEDLAQIRQLADQVAVALSNARLIEELKRQNWGTLTALARAVDAKSSWTAGHSERVAKLALKIGQALELNAAELENLHRAALLHDIGKIGISASILNKPGKLTDEEYAKMKNHPQLGARILEPIGAYASVIPLVLQHHERIDGKGYPNGLKGDEISLGGRIIAVADVYDAVTISRPYRAGWPIERAVDLIKNGSGDQFDPKVVAAFLEVMTQEEEQTNVYSEPSPSLCTL